MKKTFLAMLLVGGTMTMFAQNTQTGSTTTQGNNASTNNSSTTNSSTTNSSTTNDSTMGNTNNSNTTTNGAVNGTNTTTNGTLNNGSATNGTTTNGTTTNGTMNNGTTTNGTVNGSATANGSWNGVSASTSWTPETAPTYGWNSYGNWQNSGSVYATGNNNNSSMNNAASANGSMNSSGSYSAYGGTAVANLPANVQTRFGQDFPAGANNQYSWNQYGDWFHTHYISGGRLWQYFYSQRGDGYALVLPVIQTYVPENIISSAIQKYGSSLYSIAMVKTNNGNNAYQIGLLQGGQMNMQYLDENGATVADVWRVDTTGSMQSTQSNAAMGQDTGRQDMNNPSSMSGNSGNQNSGSSSSNSSLNSGSQSGSGSTMDNSSSSGTTNDQSSGSDKTKMKIKHADGSVDKIKTKNGQTKVKTTSASNNTSNQQ